MRDKDNTRSGGEVLVDQLVAQGVRHAFCVPGESYLAALDAFHDRDVAVTVCRQEGGAVMMAEAVGKLTGRPGVAFVTRGPGATNGSPGLHIARQDSTPLIMFVGQVARDMREREAFQELDYRAVFGTVAKWATEIDDPARIPELVSRAFYTATSGRPGPVVMALPEDMLVERVSVADALAAEPVETWPGLADMSRLQKLLWRAERPVMLLGGSRWSEAAYAAVGRFAERFALPVVTTFRRGHLFDALHPCYAGDLGVGPNPKLVSRIKAADLVILLGGRLGELPSQSYTVLDIPTPKTTLVHVHPGAEELGRVYRPHLAINASPTAFAAALEGLQPPNEIRWRDQAKSAHDDYLAWTEAATAMPGAVNLGEIMVWLRGVLPPDSILCNGAGNFSGWLHRFYRFRRFGTLLGPTSGSMGYGVPAAIAAKRLYPERTVFCLAGDGDFLMNGQEFATAVQYDLPITVAIVDNGMYGTIRMHQEREYPGRVIGTALRNPDFAAYAKAFGGFGATVERTADFAPAFEAAQKSGKPAILHLRVDPEGITTSTTLGAIRDKSLAARRA
ncbi:MAG: thiamine pyrophosphate-binding protein [Bradyrhizobiaceae bacterium]|nr:MAG: thiamine pyrophosphate-binding protein [Bradyrhizobiaceae bacterium]